MSSPEANAQTAPSRGMEGSFIVVAVLGFPIAAAAWTWYGLAQFEAQTEQGKALAAGTTMAGTGEIMGGAPLVLAHIVGLVTLVVLGWKAQRGRGIALAVLALAVTSVVGIVIAQVLWEGQLFQLGINNDVYVP